MKPETLAGLERITRDFEQFASVVRQETAATVALEDHVALIKHFADLRVIADRAKTIREALYDIEDHLSRTDIPDLFAKQKIKTINLEGIGRITVAHKFSASIIDDPNKGKEPGYDWLRSNDAGDLIKPTVNASALASYARKKLEDEGVDLPPTIFKVGTTPYTSITKG